MKLSVQIHILQPKMRKLTFDKFDTLQVYPPKFNPLGFLGIVLNVVPFLNL